jgi:hypothetical protein
MAERDRPVASSAGPEDNGPFDVATASAAYAQLLGIVAGFVVTALVLVFTVPPSGTRLPAIAVDLLVGSLIATTVAAYSFATLATARSRYLLIRAVGYLFVSGGGSLVSLFGAFTALAIAYDPSTVTLFWGVTIFAVVAIPLPVWLRLGRTRRAVLGLLASEAFILVVLILHQRQFMTDRLDDHFGAVVTAQAVAYAVTAAAAFARVAWDEPAKSSVFGDRAGRVLRRLDGAPQSATVGVVLTVSNALVLLALPT